MYIRVSSYALTQANSVILGLHQNQLHLGETTMQTGIVKWFDTVKGFGFIRPDRGDRDVFVHMSAVREAGLTILTEGQRLQFDVIADKRSGKNAASNLRLE